MSPENTSDHEEKEQCIKMHEIIAEHHLDGEFRYSYTTGLRGHHRVNLDPPEFIPPLSYLSGHVICFAWYACVDCIIEARQSQLSWPGGCHTS